MNTPLASVSVGVIVERTKSDSRWSDYLWRPVSVLAGVPDTPPWSKLDGDEDRMRFTQARLTSNCTAPKLQTTATIWRAARRFCGWCCSRPEAIHLTAST